MLFAWVSDKYHQRAATIGIQTMVTIVGLVLTGFATSPGWRYAGTLLCLEHVWRRSPLLISISSGIFLSNAGSGGCIPGIIAYVSFQ
jgi:hypothetical protein